MKYAPEKYSDYLDMSYQRSRKLRKDRKPQREMDLEDKVFGKPKQNPKLNNIQDWEKDDAVANE